MLVGARPLDRQDLTCFRGVMAVVPAHLVIATKQSVTSRRYWNFDTRRRLRLKTTGEYVEAFHEQFAEAVKRRARSAFPVAFSVSGGLDSSSIFCQAETLPPQRHAGGTIDRRPFLRIGSSGHRRAAVSSRYRNQVRRAFRSFRPRNTHRLRSRRERAGGGDRSAVCRLSCGVSRASCIREPSLQAHVRMLSGQWGDQMLFSSAYLIDLFRRGAWPSIWQHTREYGRYFGNEETARRRRLLLLDAARYHVPRSLAAPLKWLRMQAVRTAQTEGVVRAVVSRDRAAAPLPAGDARRPVPLGPCPRHLHRGAFQVPGAMHGVECQGRGVARARNGVSISRSRSDCVSDGDSGRNACAPWRAARAAARGDAWHPARFDPDANMEVGFQRVRQPGRQRRRRRNSPNIARRLSGRAVWLSRWRTN